MAGAAPCRPCVEDLRSPAQAGRERGEAPFFAPGEDQLVREAGSHELAPAICYESLQADGVGPRDHFVSVVQSAAWNARGELAQLDAASEGFVLVDTMRGNATMDRLR